MDRRRAAGALLALAACIATTAAAPTASNQTALDLYDESTEGCYYNFQHYGEGDRIMTNEPCLNCTCHNRMLMCYLRVCPFTKAIGQDCTVEKRADQCCPIVTCPDVPVDLLTSTSTSSPAEYGGTGVGKVDKYGCSIDGKYFSEGAKVPPTPGKPCEHCYCIRNMTTCVMQECTLHVDGCTPIYHKDVCCPVRYFCDHPEDEIPLLDDMTTTVRPTQGFLLTTTAPTEAPTTMTPPARRDCIEDDQLYADGALIKTDKPCEHCYCMKGDIVCVVQECGTPMENEGKNCTSLAPREGQCCPDTYICEGDELSTDVPMTKLPIEETITTIVPPRRVSVEGSGYRNEPDEVPYTEVPTFATELEGSGEDELAQKPEKETPEEDLIDKFGPTQEAEFIPLTTQIPIQEIEKATTEPDKGLNTVPSEEKEQTESATSIIAFASSEPSSRDGQATTPETIPEEEKTSESSLAMETTPVFDAKATEPSLAEEQSTESSIVPETESPSKEKDTMPKEEDKVTEPSVVSEPEEITIKPGEEIITDTSAEKESSPTESTKLPSVSEEDIAHTERTQESTDVSIEPAGPSEAQTTIMPLTEEGEQPIPDSRRTTSELDFGTSPKSVEEEITEASVSDIATSQDKLDVTEPSISEQNTVPVSDEERSSEAPALEKTTTSDKTEQSSTTDEETTPVKPPLDEEISEPSVYEKTTVKSEVETTKVTVNVPADRFTTEILNEDEQSLTTEPTYRKEEEVTSPEESISELETSTSAAIAKETVSPVDITVSTERASTSETEEHEIKLTTTPAIAEKQEEKEVTTESIMELSTFAHVSDKESTTLVPETEARPTVSATEKIELPETTTINPADNEIAEVPSPGRIPGEGDCLLEGTTYKNDSIVPSMNKCHSGCKCVSSIIKCDPIICSPPPEDMDNCQPRYDMPEACCPTYVCDHGMETIPPQPQSHITGTESPTPSVECAGDKCEKTEDKQPPTIPSQTPENVETSECGSSGCDQNAQLPAEPCTDNKCEVQPPMELEQPQKIPFNKIPQSCANSEDCKETGPVPCEGESCTAGQGEHCDKEGGCITKPDAVPHEETPQVCANEEECKQVKIPEPAAACEGESCTNIQEDCSTGKCKVTSTLPQPSQQDEKCSEENGCKKPEEAVECENGKCETDKTTDQCIGEECMQQQPISPTQEIAYTGSVNTESPATEQITSKLPTLEEEMQPAELPTTATQEAVTTEASITIEADKDIKEPEHAVTEEQVTKMPEEIVTSRVTEVTQPVSESIDTEQKVTETSPEKVAAAEDSVTKAPLEHITVTESLESLSTESSPQSEDGIKSTEKNIEQPEQITESPEVYSDKPDVTIEKETEAPTEVTKEQIDETQSSELPESHEGTKAPEKVEDEQDQITLSSESPVTEKETKQEEEPVKTSTESPVPELVTEELSKETPRLPETSESTEPSIQESQETKNPDITTISDDSERKTAAYTTSPIMHEVVTVTPSYEKETVSAEDTQTETPSAHVTEPQATVPKEDIDKLTTHVPERSGVEDQDETTTSVLDVAQTVGSAETKLPESEDKYTTTEMPMHPAISDEYGPMENIPVEQEKESEPPIIGLQTTISPDEKETSTLAQQTESEEPTAVDEKETITTTEMTITEKEKETESPPSHITEQPQTDATTASAVIEQDEVPDLSSTKPQDEEKIKETVSPSDAESTDAPQQSITEKIIPDQEKEEFTEVPTSAVTEPAETLSIEQELSTKTPPITESPTGTAASQETEVPEVLEKTTSIPSQPAISEIEQEKVTAAREPTITEEYEISTEEPEKPEQEEHHTRITEVIPTEQDDLVTKEPEFYVTETIHTHKTTESFEETEKEKATELPVPVIETEGTQKPEITEPIQTESHIPVTEHQKIPERTDEEMSTTESSISEREKTEIPEDFTTKQTFTESPQLHETKQKETIQPGELTTVASHLGDTESEKPSTDQTFEDNLPTKQSEPESPEEQKTENEEIPVVSIPTQEVEGHMTELPEAQQTAAAPAEPASPDVSEATTSSSTLQETGSEEKQTEHPVSVITETEIPSELSPQEPTSGTDKTGQDQDEMQIKEHETKPEELPESPVEISTIIPVPEEDKQQMSEKPEQTIRPKEETTPYSVELEEHTHKTDEEETTIAPSDEIASSVQPGITPSEKLPLAPSDEPTIVPSEGPVITPSEKPTVPLSEESTIGSDSVVPSSEESTVGPLGTMPSSSEQSTVSPLGTVPSSEESTDGSLDTVTSSEESTDSSLASVPSLEVSTVGTLGTVPSSEESTIGPSGIVPSSEESVIIPLGESTVTPAGEANIDLSEGSSITPSDVPSEGVVAPSEEPTGVPLGETDVSLLEEPTTARSEMQSTEPHATEIASEKLPSEEIPSKIPEIETERPSDQKDEVPLATEGPHTTALLEESEKSTESVAIEETSETTKPSDVLVEKYGSPEEDIEKEAAPTTSKQVIEEVTPAPSIETEKPTSLIEPEMEATAKPQYIPVETTAPEEEFIPVTTKATTTKVEEVSTELAQSKPEEKPSELPTSTAPEISKPDEMQPVDEVPSPEDESHFPPSGGYNQEPDYVEEDQAFGPGTCRYGGKVYVSAQQIPRDDPCDFCFCFRSDIICLQQSCPPPIHGCHEEPIQGFCCPRYECPVSMASTLNVTTTTTTTTTTLPPHFLPHAYKGAVTRKGCQIKGHTYQVGEVVRASSGPCLHCTCGGDGQMKCDPKQCTPEPMLRQMIAAAVSAKRRR